MCVLCEILFGHARACFLFSILFLFSLLHICKYICHGFFLDLFFFSPLFLPCRHSEDCLPKRFLQSSITFFFFIAGNVTAAFLHQLPIDE